MRRTTNRKGITPIISVILLLMMTIAIAGLAYTWLQGLQGGVQSTGSETAGRLQAGSNVELRIDGISLEECTVGRGNATVVFRNKGTERANNIQLFVDDVFASGVSIDELNGDSTKNFTGRNFATTGNVLILQNQTWNNTRHTFKIVSDESTAQMEAKLFCS